MDIRSLNCFAWLSFLLCTSPILAVEQTTGDICSAVDVEGDETSLLQSAAKFAPKESADSCRGVAEGPMSILEVLGSFPEPEPKAPLLNLARRRDSGRRVAVCMTGHVRTFALPGVYSSLAENVMGTVGRGGRADLFFYGHLGEFGHTKSFFKSPESTDDPALEEAFAFPGLNLVYKELHSDGGSCKDLESLWQREGVQKNCTGRNSRYHLPMFWMDRCVEKVRTAEEPYDLIVMTRPDVSVFAPMPWELISTTKVKYMMRPYGCGEDWFFTMPLSAVDAYWDLAKEKFFSVNEGNKRTFDVVVYPRLGDNSSYAEHFRVLTEPMKAPGFPAIIVRSASHADCARLPRDMKYAVMCWRYQSDGYFEKLHLS